MIYSLLLKKIEKGLNAYLRLDPHYQKSLGKLSGKTFTVELSMIHFVFQMTFFDDHIELTQNDTLLSEFKIKGTPLGLMALACNRDKTKHFFGDEISISGNAEFAQEVIQLFQELHIDWEEHLSQWIGDTPAYQVSKFSKKFLSWGKHAHESITRNINEYIHEQKQSFPPKEELQDFYQDIDELRMDVERLAKRIEKL